jgi:putative addiction module killer protein
VVEVLDFVDARGHVPYRDWLVTLDVAVRVRVVTATLRMQQGNFSAAKGVGTGVYELRLDTGPVYRIYFGKDGDALVILLGGGS